MEMKRFLQVVAVVAIIGFGSISAAKADGTNGDLFYSLTGPDGATASFYLPVNPVIPADDVDPGYAFMVTPVDLMVDGSADTTGYVTFYDITFGGGLTIDQGDVFDTINPSDSSISLFTSGTEAAPEMLDVVGPIPLDDFMTGDSGYTLTITPTPEPGVLLMIGAGVIALFVAKRRFAVSQ
jgi:hypothetical protein